MINDELKELSPWVMQVARAFSYHTPSRTADLHQEGMIAAWQGLVKARELAVDSPTAYARRYAKTRMLSLVCDDKKHLFGAVERGRWTAIAEKDLLPTPGGQASVLDTPVDYGDPGIAYHKEEIYEALMELGPQVRKYIVLRFWVGCGKAERKQIFGYDPDTLWYHPARGAKLILKQRLGHLKELAYE